MPGTRCDNAPTTDGYTVARVYDDLGPNFYARMLPRVLLNSSRLLPCGGEASPILLTTPLSTLRRSFYIFFM